MILQSGLGSTGLSCFGHLWQQSARGLIGPDNFTHSLIAQLGWLQPVGMGQAALSPCGRSRKVGGSLHRVVPRRSVLREQVLVCTMLVDITLVKVIHMAKPRIWGGSSTPGLKYWEVEFLEPPVLVSRKSSPEPAYISFCVCT